MRNTGFPLQLRNLVGCIDARSLPDRNPGNDSLINASCEHDAIDGEDSILQALESPRAADADSQRRRTQRLFRCADRRQATVRARHRSRR
jgi:hypothetical protein